MNNLTSIHFSSVETNNREESNAKQRKLYSQMTTICRVNRKFTRDRFSNGQLISNYNYMFIANTIYYAII